MRLDSILSLFSRRSPNSVPDRGGLTPQFRNRVLMFCRDLFQDWARSSGVDYSVEFWTFVHTRFQYLLGRPRLSDRHADSQVEDVFSFLSTCRDEHFLDFLELIFQFEHLRKVTNNEDELVRDINGLLKMDDLPYALTDFVIESHLEDTFFGRREVWQRLVYPQVIRSDNQLEFVTAIQPALSLLSDEAFTSANLEFREALADYRRGDYGDCLVKCNSAFESVMKIVCHRKGWPYQQSDTAASLLRVVLQGSDLDSFFEQPLLVIATLRNRLSTGHGAGLQQRDVPPHVAKFAINATAAAVLLLVEATS